MSGTSLDGVDVAEFEGGIERALAAPSQAAQLARLGGLVCVSGIVEIAIACIAERPGAAGVAGAGLPRATAAHE